MAKQQYSQKETQISTNAGVGKQIERSVTVDDLSLPSPSELEAYKKINPEIVSYLVNAAKKEQQHRHDMVCRHFRPYFRSYNYFRIHTARREGE